MDAGVAAMEWIILFLMMAVDGIRIFLGLEFIFTLYKICTQLYLFRY